MACSLDVRSSVFLLYSPRSCSQAVAYLLRSPHSRRAKEKEKQRERKGTHLRLTFRLVFCAYISVSLFNIPQSRGVRNHEKEADDSGGRKNEACGILERWRSKSTNTNTKGKSLGPKHPGNVSLNGNATAAIRIRCWQRGFQRHRMGVAERMGWMKRLYTGYVHTFSAVYVRSLFPGRRKSRRSDRSTTGRWNPGEEAGKKARKK